MGKLTLSTQYGNMATEVSNTFIDYYMPVASGEFVKLYIYLLRCIADNQTTISVSALADFFNQTEADIIRGLKYWDKAGAITLNSNKKEDGSSDTSLSGITFCDLNTANSQCPEIVQATTSMTHESASVNQSPDSYPHNVVAVAANSQASHLSSSDIQCAYPPSKVSDIASANEEFRMLTFALGAYMGEELSQSALSTIAYIYDTLRFPTDLIEYLVQYCVSRNKKSMRYIETVAQKWAESGITSVSEAKASVSSHSDTTYSVLNAFGITGRTAGTVELDYINKWTDQFCFSNDIIIEACNRTLNQVHQPDFKYADSILTRWQADNVKTTRDIELQDIEYEKNKAKQFAKKGNSRDTYTGNSTRTTNRFNNFNQRTTDIDSLEKKLLSSNA